MITALELTRRETLLLGAATLASTIARPALAEDGPECHGISAFGDLKYPVAFKHFDYVDPNAPKGGTFSQVGSNRVFNQNFLTFNSLNIFILSLSETYALKYWWCSPPRTGIASVRPTV
jgi:microcin C transport system substrate-binding protein